jgi:hypothetical protein
MVTRYLINRGVAVMLIAPTIAVGKAVPPPANQRLAPGALPSSVLQPWIDWRLNNLLSPIANGPTLKHPEATGDLRAVIVDAMAKAPPNQEPVFKAAIAVCDVLCHAAEERRTAFANYHGTGSHPSSDLTAVRKHVEQRNTVRNQAFFAHAVETQWLQRAAEFRRDVSRLYAHERELEAQLKAPSSTPPGETITLQKPTIVRIKYGAATVPAGTVLRVLKRDATGIVVDYGGEAVTLPP